MKRSGSVFLVLAVAILAWRAIDSKPRQSAPGPKAAIGTEDVVNSPMVKQATDKPASCKSEDPAALIRVMISPEARVHAAAIEGARELRAGDWTTFRVVIENAAGVTAPLFIESEQLMRSDRDQGRDRWLKLTIEPTGPLTGQPHETRTLRLFSRDAGVRTALLNLNAGQGTQDLGFRSDVLLSFRINEPAK